MIHPLVVVNAVLTLAVVGAAYWRFSSRPPAPPPPPSPADVFMQSVAAEDGALGWNQLCQDLQVQLPRDVLELQTEQLRAAHAQSGATLTINHIGDWPRTGGGEIRVYVATESDQSGATAQKTYVLQTQASGCVESVQ